jgi:alpha-L-fucosidase 2
LRGLRVRGGLLLDIDWRNGMPTMVTLSAVRAAIAKLRFGQRTWNVDLGAGERLVLDAIDGFSKRKTGSR